VVKQWLTGRYHGDFSIQVEIFCVATAVIHEEKERRAQELTGRYHVHEEKESTGARSGGTREHTYDRRSVTVCETLRFWCTNRRFKKTNVRARARDPAPLPLA